MHECKPVDRHLRRVEALISLGRVMTGASRVRGARMGAWHGIDATRIRGRRQGMAGPTMKGAAPGDPDGGRARRPSREVVLSA
jgi:hypothetical protein